MDLAKQLTDEKVALLRRLALIDSLLQQQEQLESRIKKLLATGTQDLVVDDADGTPSIQVETSKRPRPSLPEVVKFERHVREILSNAESPMDRTALLKAMTNRGVSIPGKDEKNTLGARLSRMSDVENIRGFGYWLSSRKSALPEEIQEALRVIAEIDL